MGFKTSALKLPPRILFCEKVFLDYGLLSVEVFSGAHHSRCEAGTAAEEVPILPHSLRHGGQETANLPPHSDTAPSPTATFAVQCSGPFAVCETASVTVGFTTTVAASVAATVVVNCTANVAVGDGAVSL